MTTENGTDSCPSTISYKDEFFNAVQLGGCDRVIAILKQEDVNINAINFNDDNKRTALLYAAEANDTEMIKTLVRYKAKNKSKLDVNLEDDNGRRAIWWASYHGNLEMTELLLKKGDCDVNVFDQQTGTRPLFCAIAKKSTDVAKALVSARADVNTYALAYANRAESPLMKAIALDNKELCESLVNSLCKINHKTPIGLTALHFAVAYHRYEICEFLLENGSKINTKSNNGITAMTIAIEHHDAAMCKILIEKGYKIDRKYQWKETPLTQALKLHCESCAITLLHYGCKVSKSKEPSYFQMAITERLFNVARFLLELNPAFIREKWVSEKKWPVSIYYTDMFEWLQRQSRQVFNLKTLCRSRIFQLLGRYPSRKADSLPLPSSLIEYLKFNEHIKRGIYKQKQIEEDHCPFDCPPVCPKPYCPDIDISSDSDSDS